MTVELRPFSVESMVRAVEKVRERLRRSTSALERAGVPYAVIGGNAVAAWVARVDESAVRNTQDVDILVRRVDLDAVRAALEPEGFIFRHSSGIDVFLDGPDAKARDAVHILFANEKVRPEDSLINPDVTNSEMADAFRILSLHALIQIKLSVFRRKDQVHLLDMIEVGLIDDSWPARFPPELGARLQSLIDTPGG